MRPLKICLWVTGLLCPLALLGLFASMSSIESLATKFGSPAFPDSALFRYALRAMFGTCLAAGVFYIILALRPMKYGVLVPFSGLALILVGAVCLVSGVRAGLPALAFLWDVLVCEVLGALIVVFWLRARAPARASAEPPPGEPELELGDRIEI